jgi:hypothetical protein
MMYTASLRDRELSIESVERRRSSRFDAASSPHRVNCCFVNRRLGINRLTGRQRIGVASSKPDPAERANRTLGKYRGMERGERIRHLPASATPDASPVYPVDLDLKAVSLFSEENSLIRRLNSLLLENNSLFG